MPRLETAQAILQTRRSRSAQHTRTLAPLLAVVLVLAAVAAALPLRPAGVARAGDGERLYDSGPVLVPVAPPGGVVLELLVDFFTDCTGTSGDPGSCGPPAGRWVAPHNPVEFCTFQNNRPGSFTAQQFRDTVAKAVATWNAQEAAVGVRYDGDCASGFRWEFGNDRNEIGWDDRRNAVSGSEAGVTRGTWLPLPGDVKQFVEFDVVFEGSDVDDIPLVCFNSIVAHELGHALGFGHSDEPGDLMFPTFKPSDVSTCQAAPTNEEQSRLQELYGVDRNPTVSAGSDRIVDTGATVALIALGSDPEGSALSYVWQQLSGPAVALSASGASVSFTAPTENGITVVLEVTAFDAFLHSASASITITVGTATAPPSLAPSLKVFLAGPQANARLTWSEVSGAASYELCSKPAGATVEPVCNIVGAPIADVSWDTVLGTTGSASDLRVFTAGARETFLRACNSQGCSPAGTGGLTGGLRWPAWDIDFDYFALEFDSGSLQFTIVGVVNVSGAPRSFTLYSGPPEDPTRVRLRACGTLPPGAACLDFLGPDDEHFSIVDIVSKRAGAPNTEHRITVR